VRAGGGDGRAMAAAMAGQWQERMTATVGKMALVRQCREGEGVCESWLETVGLRWQWQGDKIGERWQAGERVL